MRIRLAVLDVGGTVIHDTADVPAVFRAALARHGLSATDSQLHAWRGRLWVRVSAQIYNEQAEVEALADAVLVERRNAA